MNSSVWAVWAAQDSKGKLALNEATAASALNQPPPFIGETPKLLSVGRGRGIFDRCVNPFPLLFFFGGGQIMPTK